MPNLSPAAVRGKYEIYSGKASSGSEAIEGIESLKKELTEFEYTIDYGKGDYNEQL